MLHHTIISEIGQNHCGDMGLAEYLICQSGLNGADLVKFQLYDSEKLYGKKQDTELSFEQAKHLFDYGKENGIEIFFSVFDERRIAWCEEMKVSHYKISCAMSTNVFLVNSVLDTKVYPIMLSTSGKWGKDSRFSTLYCIPKYPASVCDLRFSEVDFVNDFQGFSDHTIGLDAAKIALARGAAIIEKHFALDHKTGVDAPWSMDISELKELKRWLQALSFALG